MNRIGIFLLLGFYLLLVGIFQSCSTEEIESWKTERALYFEKHVFNEERYEWERIDTASISITNYFGQDEIKHYFKINLLGDTLKVDMEYALVVVDSMTTAKEGMVTLPEKVVFRKGVVSDSLVLTVHADKVPEGEEYKITYRLIPNEYFILGYKGYLQVSLRFNNKVMCPPWWDYKIVEVYLGEWSQKKMETLYIATDGINSFENLRATERRYYALQLKQYIEKNGITEEDGTPMMVPIY